MMVSDMKGSGEMINIMAKVRNKSLIYYFLTRTLFNNLIGKLSQNDGERYEGEWRDGKRNGQGRNEVINFMIC